VSAAVEGSVSEARRQATVDAIEEAACELLLRDGLDITMDDIARAAGVSRRTLFRYFETRERLLASAFEHGIQRYGEHLPVLDGDWRDALRSLCDAAHRMQASYGLGYWELLHRRDLPPELEAVEHDRRVRRRRAMDHLAAELHRLAGGSGPPPPELSATVATFLSARFTAAVVQDAEGSWTVASQLAYEAIAAAIERATPMPPSGR
jgi:AcrR family transcriptional regulator